MRTTVATILCMLSGLSVHAAELQHEAPSCLAAGHPARLGACAVPPQRYTDGRIYFRDHYSPHWYFVETSREAGCFWGVLPKTRGLREVVYYFEVQGPEAAVTRTPEHTLTIVGRADQCEGRVAPVSPVDPTFVGATAGAPLTAAGFGERGGGGKVPLIAGAAVGVVGAGAALAMGGGGADAVATPELPRVPGITTPAPTATSPPTPSPTAAGPAPTPTDPPATPPPPGPTPTQAPNPTPTLPPLPTATRPPNPTATLPSNPTPTLPPQPTSTLPPAPTSTQTTAPTSTPTATTAAPTSTATPRATATSTPTPGATATTAPRATETATSTATEPPAATATATPTPEPIATSTPTPSPVGIRSITGATDERMAASGNVAWAVELSGVTRARLIVNGRLAAELGAGVGGGSLTAAPGENRVELEVLEARGSGRFLLRLSGSGFGAGTLRPLSGEAQVAGDAIVFRLTGRAGERAAFAFGPSR